MVSINFIVLVLALVSSFLLGRSCGSIETSVRLHQRFAMLISAIKQVEALSSLSGEDLSKVPIDEIVSRAKTHMSDGENDHE